MHSAMNPHTSTLVPGETLIIHPGKSSGSVDVIALKSKRNATHARTKTESSVVVKPAQISILGNRNVVQTEPKATE